MVRALSRQYAGRSAGRGPDPGGSAPGDRRDDRHRVTVGDIGGQTVAETDVVIGDVEVHEASQLTVLEQLILESGMLRLERIEHRRHGAAFDLDLRRPAGQSTEGGGNTDGDGHEN